MGAHVVLSASPNQESRLLSLAIRLKSQPCNLPTSAPVPSASLLAFRLPAISVHASNILFHTAFPGNASFLQEAIPEHPGWVCSPGASLYLILATLYGCKGHGLCLIISVHPPPIPTSSAWT